MTINVGINGFGRIGRSTLSHITKARETTSMLQKLMQQALFKQTRTFLNMIVLMGDFQVK